MSFCMFSFLALVMAPSSFSDSMTGVSFDDSHHTRPLFFVASTLAPVTLYIVLFLFSYKRYCPALGARKGSLAMHYGVKIWYVSQWNRIRGFTDCFNRCRFTWLHIIAPTIALA